MKCMLKNVRLAFPTLFTPKSVNGGDPTFSASLIIEPGSAAETAIRKAINEAAEAKWGAKAKTELAHLEKKDKLCLHDGDDKSRYSGFEGNIYVSATNRSRPKLFDRHKDPVVEADDLLYAGCYVNVAVDVWAQDNQFGRRVNASLLAMQFFRHGDAFAGGAQASSDDFDDLGDEDDDELQRLVG